MTAVGDPDKKLEFLWMLQSACNYPCVYCGYNGAIRDSLLAQEKRFPVERWEKAWRRVHRQRGETGIMITGAGEPTLYPGFLELLKAITPYHAVIFDTNLSWSKDEIGRFCREIEASRLRRIQTSFHPLTASKEEFADKLTILRDNGYRYQCRWVAYPPLLGRLPEFRDYFRSRGLEFVVSPYWGEHGGRRYPEGYTSQQGRMFVDVAAQNADETVSAEHTRQLLNMPDLRPAGRLCRSGCDYVCIMPDGRVYRCRQYAMRGMSPLGTFFDEELPLSAESATCRSPDCGDEYRWLVSEVPA